MSRGDAKLRELERAFIQSRQLSDFEKWRVASRRVGVVFPPDQVAEVFASRISDLLPDGITASFDLGNWSQYSEADIEKFILEVFWFSEEEIANWFGDTRWYNENGNIRDLCVVRVDLEQRFFEIERLPSNFHPPRWVRDIEDPVIDIIRMALLNAGLVENQVRWVG